MTLTRGVVASSISSNYSLVGLYGITLVPPACPQAPPSWRTRGWCAAKVRSGRFKVQPLCGAMNHVVEDYAFGFGHNFVERLCGIHHVCVGQSLRHLQVGLSLPGGFLERKLLLAGLNHFRRGIEKDDQMGRGNQATDQASQPKRSSVTVPIRVHQQILV